VVTMQHLVGLFVDTMQHALLGADASSNNTPISISPHWLYFHIDIAKDCIFL